MPSGRSIYELLQDYLTASDLLRSAPKQLASGQSDLFRSYMRFVSVEGHKLARSPDQLLPLAVAQPLDSPVRKAGIERCTNGCGPDGPWFRLLNPEPSDPNRALLRVYEGHRNFVTSVCISPDGHWALSGGYDDTLRLWDLSTGQELRRLEGHTDRVTSVCVTSDGHRGALRPVLRGSPFVAFANKRFRGNRCTLSDRPRVFIGHTG